MSAQVMQSDAHLFDVRPGLRFTQRFTRYGIGDKPFTGPNPSYGALITYYLKDKPDDKTPVKIQILDQQGALINELNRPGKEKGVNRVTWDLRYGGPRVRRPPTDEEVGFFGGPRGPQVLPGVYTVKLAVGNRTVEKRVEVRLDPNVSATPDDLRAQRDLGLKLRDMQSAINESLRTFDSIKSQLENIERTMRDRLPDAPEEAKKAIADYKKQIDALSETLSRPEGGLGFSGRAQLLDRTGGLFFAIDGVNAAPTPAQRRLFDEVRAEFQKKMEEVNRFITQSVPQMNETLRRQNLPQLIAGKPIEIPR
jgi:hypothetical protein